MNVLVTGASGQLGPFVIRALRERHDLVLMSRHPPHTECAALPWIQGDLTVFDDCRQAVQGVDAIQHLAAQPWPVDHPTLRGRAAAHGLPAVAMQKEMLWTHKPFSSVLQRHIYAWFASYTVTTVASFVARPRTSMAWRVV